MDSNLLHKKLFSDTGLSSLAKTISLGSFQDASKSMGMSPGYCRKKVRKLETDLQCELVKVARGEVSATGEGVALIQHTIHMLRAFDEFKEIIQG